MVLPYINMNLPQVYTCSSSWTLFPPCINPPGRSSAPAPSIQHQASTLDWRVVSHIILYMFQCHSPKSSHPLPLPQSPKDCSIHQLKLHFIKYSKILLLYLLTYWRMKKNQSVSCSCVSESSWPRVACQAPLSMEFSRQEHWSVEPLCSSGDLSDLGIKPSLLHCRKIWVPREAFAE